MRPIMAAQWREPVRFRETVEAMYGAGCRVFVEAGPSGVLTGFVRDTLRGRPHLAVATDDPRRPGTEQLAHAVAQLATHGLDLDLDVLYARRGRPLDGAPSHRSPVRVSTALPLLHLAPRPAAVSGSRNGRPSARPRWFPCRARRPALAIPTSSSTNTPPPRRRHPPQPADSTTVVEAYLATMERFLATQRDVMTAYLGGEPGAPAPDAPPPAPTARPEAPPAPAPEPAPQSAAEPAAATAPGTPGSCAGLSPTAPATRPTCSTGRSTSRPTSASTRSSASRSSPRCSRRPA
ncbi:MAG: hypothetical protein R2736_09315 [Solirubrobacterales bacterium]